MFRSNSHFSNNLSRIDHNEAVKQNATIHKIISITAVAAIEFLLSSIFFTYGVLLSFYVDTKFYTTFEGLWAIILFLFFSGLTDPWARELCEYFEYVHYNGYKIIVSLSTVLLGTTFVLFCIFINSIFHILAFGIIGGCLSKLISVQTKYRFYESYDADFRIFEGIKQLARMLSLMSSPMFILLLVEAYGVFRGELVFGAVLFHIIPIAFLIKSKKKKHLRPHYISRYKSVHSIPGNMTEFIKISPCATRRIDSFHKPLMDENFDNDTFSISYNFEELPAEEDIPYNDDNINYRFTDQHFNNVTTEDDDIDVLVNMRYSELNPNSVQTYYKNAGVSILPEIPEEPENDEEDGGDINTVNSKRVSKISTKLEELHENKLQNTHRDSLLCSSTHQISFSTNPEEILDDGLNVFKDLNHRQNYLCTPYRKYKWRRRFRRLNDVMLDYFLKPFYCSVKNVHFYPSLISKICTTVISSLVLTLLPSGEILNANMEYANYSKQDMTILLSFIAFFSCLYCIVAAILLKHLSTTRIRFSYVIGLLMSGGSMMILFYGFIKEISTISWILFGFGYGMVNYMGLIVHRNFIGSAHWTRIQGTLETLTAIFIIIIYNIIYHLKLDYKCLLHMAYIAYISIALLWCIAPLFKFIINTMKNHFSRQDSVLY